jgi:2-polyprenyl-3-methyl-5-hydroxy-6-metoxy-1,4-benzoquinol methylase
MRIDEKSIFKGEYSAEKYQSKNPIGRYLVNKFLSNITELVESVANNKRIHEIGCGEGQITGLLYQKGFEIRGTDIRKESIEVAKKNAFDNNLDIEFKIGSIYELEESDISDIIMCCEVLEHLENPILALENLKEITSQYIILSVPREPIWRLMNMARGKYLSEFGNTPDHIQHWSTKSFKKLVSNYFNIIEVRQPLPWTILLCEIKK